MSLNRRYSKEPKSVKDIIDISLNRGPLFLLFQNQRILDLWPRVAGDAAKRATPYLFQDGILYVKVENSVYAHKYRFSVLEWVNGYQREMGAPIVEKIVLRLAESGGKNVRVPRNKLSPEK
jgi:hypothetical protein